MLICTDRAYERGPERYDVVMAAKKKRSTLKRIRQTGRRTGINTLARSASRTAVREARAAIAAGAEGVEGLVRTAASMLDRAVKRRAIPKNVARRTKSRLAKQAARREPG